MKYKCLSILTFFILSSAASADEFNNTKDESVNENGRLRIYLALDQMILALEKIDTRIIGYQTNRNAGISIGAEINYKNIGAAYWKDISTGNESSKYSKTSIEGFQLYYFSEKLGIDLLYQDVAGFYMKTPDEFGLNPGDPGTVRNDLSVKLIGVNGYYSFSEKFSLMSAFQLGAAQTVSGGSFVIMTSAVRYNISGNFPLVPASHDEGEYKGFKNGEFYGLSINPGYAHFFIKDNLYLSLMAFVGGGVMKKKYQVEKGSIAGWGAFSKANLKISSGYNSTLLFGGISLFCDSTSSTGFWEETDELSVETYVYRLELFAGVRF